MNNVEYPGWITMVRSPVGMRPAAIMRFVDALGAYSAIPVFDTREEAEDPPREALPLRVLNSMQVEGWPIRDAWDAAAMAHVASGQGSVRFRYLWSFGQYPACVPYEHDDVLHAEAMACEQPVAIVQADVEAARQGAWEHEFSSPRAVRPDEAVSRSAVIDRFLFGIVVIRAGRELYENLVAKYRGTPRKLTDSEREAIMSAWYDLEHVERDSVEGPVSVAGSMAELYRRRISVGPRPCN